MQSRVICVGGAVTYDYLVFPMTTLDDHALHVPHDKDQPDLSQLVVRSGSAALVAQLLSSVASKWNYEVLAPALRHPAPNCLKHNASTIVNLSAKFDDQAESPVGYNVTQVRNIGKPPIWHSPPAEQVKAASGSTVVLAGSGEAFQDVEPALDFLQHVNPKYIIHHMTRPLACGKLWDIIRDGPMVRGEVPDPDHLAVIIDADDLRAEGIPLSRSLSWEATAQDFVLNLGSNGRLDTLVTCPNLIVRFGNEGVIHHRGRDAVDPKLYFHPQKMEMRNDHMVGLASAFTAGFAIGFPDTDRGIRLGMAAANRLTDNGFTPNHEDSSPEYPIENVMNDLQPFARLSTVSVPSTKISSGDTFSIFNALTGDPHEVARTIVEKGPDRALSRCSVRRFGDLQSVERTEQESLGSIVETMNERLESDDTSPTCIGMIGPMGSGKKFVARNISEQVDAKWTIRRMTYNARVVKTGDLTSICHTIRDNAAEHALSVVSFENCETLLRSDQTLLDEFISVMRYGIFKDGDHQRKVGRCLLVFLLNQDQVSDAAPTPMSASDYRPSFGVDETLLLDNLHGVVHLMGPNQAGPEDKFYPIRRSLMLRQLLKDKHPHIEKNGTMRIDQQVLHALLTVPSYKHGLRSLEKIISTSRLSGRNRFDVSALPPEEQIQLHVDGRIFMSYLRSPRLQPTLRETLAEGLFRAYKKQRELMARTPEEKKALESDRAMVDWDELPGEFQESTRAQADDIPRKLRAVRCFMLPEERGEPLVRVDAFTEEELLMLSEMEHERFNAERLQRQWRMGPRNQKQRTTPFLVPWRDLTQDWKDVDRVMVECVPTVLKSAGYYIYRGQE